MYILVKCKHKRTGQNCTKGYENFDEVKGEVVKILDAKGWDNKERVDLRKALSCLEYILGEEYTNIQYKLSSSYSNYYKYKYGTKALI